jgi:hypothetical protein
LPLARHGDLYPDITSAGTLEVRASTLDDVLKELGLDSESFQLLTIDVQGAEALVLSGAKATLQGIEAVQIEVNFVEMYHGGAQIDEIDQVLENAGFHRVAIASAFHAAWGDALYVRGKKRSGRLA